MINPQPLKGAGFYSRRHLFEEILYTNNIVTLPPPQPIIPVWTAILAGLTCIEKIPHPIYVSLPLSAVIYYGTVCESASLSAVICYGTVCESASLSAVICYGTVCKSASLSAVICYGTVCKSASLSAVIYMLWYSM